MRRSKALAVDTNNDLVYELAITPRSSIDSTVTDTKYDPTSLTLPPKAPTQHTITPSIRLLYSLISKKHLFCLLIPAVLSSIIAGGIAPFMTFVIGQAFDVFATFPHTPNPPQEAKDELLRGVGLAALELIGLAVGSLALGSITSSLWIWTGEVNVMALRKAVYDAVTHKDIVWFDSHMGATDAAVQSDGDSPIGAGGLMAKFTKSVVLSHRIVPANTPLQGNRRRPNGDVSRIWHPRSIPHHMRHLPHPRFHPLLGTHPCHPICSSTPSVHPKPLPRLCITSPRL